LQPEGKTVYSLFLEGVPARRSSPLANSEVTMVSPTTRRKFLTTGGVIGGALLFHSSTGSAAEPVEEDVAPAEDLMREHGVLKRCILIYREALSRLEAKHDLPAALIHQTANIIRTFIEDYHEKLEEDHIFPRFKKANKLVDLVTVLETQHKAGRKQTELTLRYATDKGLKDPDERAALSDSLIQFIRMYEPHEAREDTILFPTMRKIISAHEYAALGEDFEKKEHELFGKEGFEGEVENVARIEKSLGIYDLAQFTPK
jgi:hemerythrin-like domain-containing protein